MAENTLTSSKSRIETVDVLRGFALAGILYAHMIIWYTGAALPSEVYSGYDSTADGIALGIFGALVFGKFFSLFSFLFGLSFYLYFQRYSAKPHFFLIYAWRLFLLFLIGLAHHLLWRGDILVIYAVLGLLLLLFRYLPTKLLLGLSLLLITNLPTHLYDVVLAMPADSSVSLPMEEEAADYYALVQSEGFVTVMKDNWNSWPAKINYQLESGRFLMTFGYFLLGLYAGRKNLFHSIEDRLSSFRKWNTAMKSVILLLLAIGLLWLLQGAVTLPDLWIAPELKWTASVLFSFYNACLTIFYITGIILLFRQQFFCSILKPLGAMGKMALTNYLLQTVFGLLLYYKFGAGLFVKTSPAMNAVLAIAVFVVQLKFSQYWLSHFKQGPVEWLWRITTWFRLTSIRKRKKLTIPAAQR